MKLLRRHLKVPGHRNDENQEDGLHPRIKLIAIGNKETSQWDWPILAAWDSLY